MMLAWCATAALKKSFKLFQIYSYADTSWDDDKNSCKSTCSSCVTPFHMHSLMSSNGLLRCQLQQPILSVPVLARKKFGPNKLTFFSRWILISDRDGNIKRHQVHTSQQAADIDANRPQYGFALACFQCLETS